MEHGKWTDIPDKRHDIKSGWVIGVAEEVHKSMDDASCHLGKLDCRDMYGLNQQLSVLGCLGSYEITFAVRLSILHTLSKSAS